MQESSSWWQRPTILVALGIIGVALALLWPYLGELTAQTDNASSDMPVSDLASMSEDLPGLLDPPAETAPAIDGNEQNVAVVYISGEVIQPDVYAVPADARVKDVVMAAGGLTSQADSRQINLAARIEDAQHIHIPAIQAHSIAAAAAADQTALTGVPANGLSAPTRTNINTASQAELEELPGIGASLARRIIEYRTANGPFASPDDLQEVRGIGPTLFASIVDAISTSD